MWSSLAWHPAIGSLGMLQTTTYLHDSRNYQMCLDQEERT